MTRELVLMFVAMLLVGCVVGAIAGGGLPAFFHFVFG